MRTGNVPLLDFAFSPIMNRQEMLNSYDTFFNVKWNVAVSLDGLRGIEGAEFSPKQIENCQLDQPLLYGGKNYTVKKEYMATIEGK